MATPSRYVGLYPAHLQAVLYNAHPATPISVSAIDMERLDYLAMGLAPQWICGLAKISGTRDGQAGVNHHSGSYMANVQHETAPERRQEFIDRAMRATTLPLLNREVLIRQLGSEEGQAES